MNLTADRPQLAAFRQTDRPTSLYYFSISSCVSRPARCPLRARQARTSERTRRHDHGAVTARHRTRGTGGRQASARRRRGNRLCAGRGRATGSCSRRARAGAMARRIARAPRAVHSRAQRGVGARRAAGLLAEDELAVAARGVPRRDGGDREGRWRNRPHRRRRPGRAPRSRPAAGAVQSPERPRSVLVQGRTRSTCSGGRSGLGGVTTRHLAGHHVRRQP